MNSPRSARFLLALSATFSMATLVNAADPKPGVDYEGNLSKIPAADPPADPAAAVKIAPAHQGKHPRLLFSADEIDKLRAQTQTDPVLKKAAGDITAWARRFKWQKEEPKPAIVTNDTSALVTSTSRYIGLAYAYALDRDPSVKKAITDILTMMLEEPYWADTAELDSNMGAGNNMLMVGLLYDAVYNDLDPALRAKLARKMLTHVRRMHYLGFKQLSLMPIKYWQQDPQNNHRWHRNAGMAACLLSIADEEGLETGYLLLQLKQEMDFILKWYPHDGDCHEGATYQNFGFLYLGLGTMMMDRVLETKYLEHPGLKNVWAQHLYYGAIGRTGNQSFGDDMNGDGTPFGHLDAAFFLGSKLSRDPNIHAGLIKRMNDQSQRKDGRPVDAPWSLLTFYDGSIPQGDYKALPTYRLFADLGAASMRDSWEKDSFLFTFKCGPYGGYKLNEYRHATPDKEGKPHYINVAHDDPDANSFSLGTDGEFLFHPGLYSFQKITESQNAVTIDGKGQINEGTDYTQPVPGVDMRTLSYLTTWKADDKGRIVIEGEAARAYKGLERFRRTGIWMPGEYILLLDNIQTDGTARDITWRGTIEKGLFDDPKNGKCHIETRGGKRLDFQILANKPFTGAVDHYYLDGRFGGQLVQQFQFNANSSDAKFACLIDPWKTKPEMTLAEKDGVVTLTVKHGANVDVWTWTTAPDAQTPSTLTCQRGGTDIVTITAANKAPLGD